MENKQPIPTREVTKLRKNTKLFISEINDEEKSFIITKSTSKMNYRALEIKETRPKHRPWNVRLIPAKLEELAKAGVYFDDRVIN